ncbi:hypothetical protein Q7C_818 [Methylophaga frappieri]|uniref:Uncharacterized protein n=1 Tax=Methylophaga frappieri (strain ATCC BAA-2434 / DSM 25690 / JAM7) TaxID=754477 RepID=I1YGE4_METFJ|nr:hypothetical protein [Methylophaga frappieri]AFJ01987.1 hypothetical protein Q7C_818 [Methylophaga frappieri]
MDLTKTELDLMSASVEISTPLNWNGELFTPLSQAIEATGKKVDELTVAELRKLISDVFAEYSSLHRGTA